jgi:pimeloyl-ACP methyl ester carboxylesterase
MLLQGIREINLTAEAGEFAFPVLVGNGRFDLDVTPSTAFDLHAYARLTFYVFETIGHLPFCEQPEEFVRIVELSLDGRPLSSAESAAHSRDRTSHRLCL